MRARPHNSTSDRTLAHPRFNRALTLAPPTANAPRSPYAHPRVLTRRPLGVWHGRQVLDQILSKKRAKRLLKTSSRSTLDVGGAASDGLSSPLSPDAVAVATGSQAFSTDPYADSIDGGAGAGAAPGGPRASASQGGPRLRAGAELPTAPLCAKSMQQ